MSEPRASALEAAPPTRHRSPKRDQVAPTPTGLRAAGDRPEPRRRAALPAVVALIVAVCGLGYLPTLSGYFLADDFGYIQLYWDQPLAAFPRLFAADWSQGIWDQPLDELRPLVALSFRLNTLLSGLDPVGYHLFNLAAHVAATLLVFAVARGLIDPLLRCSGGLPGADRLTATFAALLFAVLPVHAELVGWISGRVDVMTTVFALLTILAYGTARTRGGRGPYVLAVAALALALFTKEAALSFILLLPAWDLIAAERGVPVGPDRARRVAVALARAGWRYLTFAAVLVVYLALRRVAFAQPLREGALSAGTLLEFATRQPFYLGSLIVPTPFLFDPPRPGAVGGWATWLGVAELGLLLLLALLGLWRPAWLTPRLRLAIYFGPVWYLVTTLPLIVTYPSIRHLYLPSAGLCLAVACLVPPVRGARLRPVLVAGVLVLALGWSALFARQLAAAELAATSAALHRSMVEALARTPPDTRVVLVPEVNRGERWLWRWALPFALQPPFTATDLYTRYDIIELPEAYCCPEWAWWRDRAALVQDWVADESRPTLLLVWDAPAGRLEERVLTPRDLRERLGLPPSGPVPEISGPQALRLLADLDPNPGTAR